MTIELQPKPEQICQFIFSTKNKNDIGKIISTVKDLRLDGILNSSVHIANKAIALGKNKNSKIIGEWSLSASISGPKEIIKAKKKLSKKTFKKQFPNSKRFFIGEYSLNLLRFFNKNVRKLPFISTLEYASDLLNGKPTDEPIRTLFDGLKISADLNAENTPKYFRWISATTPASETNVLSLIQTLENEFSSNELDLKLTLTSINPRTFIAITEITYEKNEKSIEKANSFYKKCTKNLAEKGFYPYRTGRGIAEALPYSNSYLDITKKIKSALDPDNTLGT